MHKKITPSKKKLEGNISTEQAQGECDHNESRYSNELFYDISIPYKKIKESKNEGVT